MPWACTASVATRTMAADRVRRSIRCLPSESCYAQKGPCRMRLSTCIEEADVGSPQGATCGQHREPARCRVCGANRRPNKFRTAHGRGASAPPLRPALAGSDDRRTIRLVAEADAPALQVVGRHFHDHAVADAGADAELAHLARRVGEDLVIVVELHTEIAVGQDFRDLAV